MDTAAPDVLRELLDRSRAFGDGRIAFADHTRKISFADLRTEVEHGACVLRASGVRGGDVVAVSLPNSVDAAVLFLAVLRAGAVWVGIDPRTPADTRNQVVSDYGATYVDAAEWDTLRKRIPADSTSELPPITDPDLPAAVAFTSGTTGAPKTVVHTRTDISLTAMAYSSVQPQTLRVGVCLSLSILNLQVLGTCAGIFSGTTTVVLRRMDARSVADAVWRYRLQKVRALVPATVYDLVHDDTISADALRSLTDAGCGAAALPESVQTAFEVKFGVPIVGSYGLTEAPAAVAAEDSSRPRVPGSSGRALPHVRIEVLDEHGARVPAGVDGMIWISPRTDGPFADLYRRVGWRWSDGAFHRVVDHDRSLRTGDIGRFDGDANLTVVGRESDIIVRGGTNISAAELERVFANLPEVVGVGVVGIPDERLGQRVFVVVEPSAEFAAIDARADLTDRLETFAKDSFIPGKGPDWVIVVDSLPRNNMGKVARAELATLVPDDPACA
jgi:acyl-CoA synthetase (AMP-forming)/AMP-acid ligase II